MKQKLVKADDLHAKWMKKPGYAKAYADLEPEFALASELIAARARRPVLPKKAWQSG